MYLQILTPHQLCLEPPEKYHYQLKKKVFRTGKHCTSYFLDIMPTFRTFNTVNEFLAIIKVSFQY